MMRRAFFLVCAAGLALGLAGLSGCASAPAPGLEPEEMDRLNIQVFGSRHDFEKANPALAQDFEKAYAYALFPRIVAGAVGAGWAEGQGQVFRRGSGNPIGVCYVRQASAGVSLGAQQYAEVIFFQNETALADFESPQYTFDARVSAVAANSGAASAMDYDRGVKVFTLPEKGFMVQAAVGGQKFTFWPKSK